MTRHLSLAIVFCLLSLCACESTSVREQRRRDLSLTTGICVIHRTPLQAATLYRQTGKGCFFYDSRVSRMYARFPNALPLFHSTSKAPLFKQPERVLYCPTCERAISERLNPEER